MTNEGEAGLPPARSAIDLAESVVADAVQALAKGGGIDVDQVVAYDLAHAASAAAVARRCSTTDPAGQPSRDLTCRLCRRGAGRPRRPGRGPRERLGDRAGLAGPALAFLADGAAPNGWPRCADRPGRRHLGEDFELVRETFHRFAEEKVRPHAEDVHRTNGDVPESIIEGLAELGGFGLSIPEEYGGFASGSESDYVGMVVATEELCWGALGIGGSLITRPEIIARALLKGGTDDQKQTWLPRLASGEALAAVAVTEPDYGSDVANLTTAASTARAAG